MSDPRPPDISLKRDYFDFVYGANEDPWAFETSPYESAKFAATVDALQRERYGSGLEIGCSTGVLTQKLASRCEQLMAVDLVPSVLERAAARCRDFGNVTFREMTIPEEFPEGQFDLIVVSEVGYYWSSADLDRAIGLTNSHLLPEGHVVLVHWTDAVHDYPQIGDEVHERFLRWGSFAAIYSDRTARYRLDVLERITSGSGS